MEHCAIGPTLALQTFDCRGNLLLKTGLRGLGIDWAVNGVVEK
jgi:hypothetical protein